jgi:hypothetical protein
VHEVTALFWKVIAIAVALIEFADGQGAIDDIECVSLIQAFESMSEITDECHEETVLQVAVATCVIEH